MLEFTDLPSEEDYNILRYTFIKQVETVGGVVNLDPYADSLGIATIGVGFNLQSNAVRLAVLEELLGTSSVPSDINSGIQSVVSNSYTGLLASSDLQNDLDAELVSLSGSHPGIPTTFTFSSETNIENIFNNLAPSYESNVEFSLGLSTMTESREGVALLSLSWNNPALLGANLISAIVNEDRAEAWYQIRYQSNGGASASSGIAKRRFYESEMFGLYKDQGHVTNKEALDVYATTERHSTAIGTYEGTYSGQVSHANTDYDTTMLPELTVQTLAESIAPAHDYLINTYASGPVAHGATIAKIWVDYTPVADDTDVSHEQNAYTGDSSNELIITGGGMDSINGGGGDDTIVVNGFGDKTIDGGSGVDTLNISILKSDGNAYSLSAHVDLGHNIFNTNSSVVHIENIVGSVTNDVLTGDTNNNVIDGHGGADVLTGGGGNNTFVWSGVVPEGATYNYTTITDAHSGDHIQLTDVNTSNMTGVYWYDPNGNTWYGEFWDKSTGHYDPSDANGVTGGYEPGQAIIYVEAHTSDLPDFINPDTSHVSLTSVGVDYWSWYYSHAVSPGSPYIPNAPIDPGTSPGNPTSPGLSPPANGDSPPAYAPPEQNIGNPGLSPAVPPDDSNTSSPNTGYDPDDSGERNAVVAQDDDGSSQVCTPFDGLDAALAGLRYSFDPLVIDMNGNGFEVSDHATNPVYWDANNDGYRIASAWVGANDALLVHDLNGNGLIDNNSELFGGATGNGFTDLVTLDSNHDGIIDSNDAAWGTLQIWIDANQDGVSQTNELQTLDQAGIQSIDVTNIASSWVIVGGNEVQNTSTVTMTDTSTKTIGDIIFKADALNTLYTGIVPHNEDVGSMADLRGYGSIKDLDMQMSLSPSLLFKISELSQMTMSDIFDPSKGFNSQFNEMLYQWGGQTPANWTTNDYYYDSQKIAFLAGLANLSQNGFESMASGGAGYIRDHALWEIVENHYEGTFLAQTAFQGLFTGTPHYDINSDAILGATGLSSAGLSAIASAISSSADHAYSWSLVVKTVDEVIGIDHLSTGDYTALDNAIQASASGWTLSSLHDAVTSSMPNVYGTSGVDNTLVGASFAENFLYGADGNDTLVGGASDDYLYGYGGNNTYYGGLGSNFFNESYGYGNATFVYGGGHDYILSDVYGTQTFDFGSGITLSDISIQILNSQNVNTRATAQRC